MSTEINIATTLYLGEAWTFLDCPGFVELAQDAYNALMVADAAVVVCEPEPQKALTLAPLLRFFEQSRHSSYYFHQQDRSPGSSVRAMLDALQGLSDRPLVLREIPIYDGDNVKGFVDLVRTRLSMV